MHREAGQRVHPVAGDGRDVPVLQVFFDDPSRVQAGQLRAEGPAASKLVLGELALSPVRVVAASGKGKV